MDYFTDIALEIAKIISLPVAAVFIGLYQARISKAKLRFDVIDKRIYYYKLVVEIEEMLEKEMVKIRAYTEREEMPISSWGFIRNMDIFDINTEALNKHNFYFNKKITDSFAVIKKMINEDIKKHKVLKYVIVGSDDESKEDDVNFKDLHALELHMKDAMKVIAKTRDLMYQCCRLDHL